jgi:hypothetical protein
LIVIAIISLHNISPTSLSTFTSSTGKVKLKK